MEVAASIKTSGLRQVLASYRGTSEFAENLSRISSNDELLRVLGRYIQFNSSFGSGVGNLAGEIFFAAIDEFGNSARTHRSTHRALAQATFKAAGLFFRRREAALNDIARLNDATLAAIRMVNDGYGINQSMSAGRIFRAIGFYLSSEALANEEFRVLENSLQARYPDLVKHLRGTEVTIGGLRQPAYLWIGIHTAVEADHFNTEVSGANRALKYYLGRESQSRIKMWII